MFGIGLYTAYGQFSIAGINGALLVALFTRLAVGVGWYRLFDRAGKNPIHAFVPMLGPYVAFRLAWDDFSFAAIFASTTFVAFVAAVGIDFPIVNACAVINFIMWWFIQLLTCRAFNFSYFLGFISAGIPWASVPLMGFWPTGGAYHGAWSTDPEADQNLSAAERKKKRRKAEKEAKKQGNK